MAKVYSLAAYRITKNRDIAEQIGKADELPEFKSVESQLHDLIDRQEDFFAALEYSRYGVPPWA